MGDPTFYYYPVADGLNSELEMLTLTGENISDFEELDPLVNQSSATSVSGRDSTVHWGTHRRYRIVLSNFQGESLIRDIRSFLTHVIAGGYFGFSLDHDKSYGAYCRTLPSRGSTAIYTKGLNFYNRSASLTTEDEVVLLSGVPETNYEILGVGTALTGSLTTTAVKYDYTVEPCMVRWRHYLPVLRVPSQERSRIALTSQHQLNWTLDLVVQEDLGAIDSLQGYAGTITDSAVPGNFGKSLESALSSGISAQASLSGGSSSRRRPPFSSGANRGKS